MIQMDKLRDGKTALQGIGVVLIVEGSRMIQSGELETGAIIVALGLVTIHSYHLVDEKKVREIIGEFSSLSDVAEDVGNTNEEEED